MVANGRPPLSFVQVNVGSYLQLLCLAENTRTDPRDVSTMLSLNGCDIRQSLLHLQYWTRSSGGRPAPCVLPRSLGTGTEAGREELLEGKLPKEKQSWKNEMDVFDSFLNQCSIVVMLFLLTVRPQSPRRRPRWR